MLRISGTNKIFNLHVCSSGYKEDCYNKHQIERENTPKLRMVEKITESDRIVWNELLRKIINKLKKNTLVYGTKLLTIKEKKSEKKIKKYWKNGRTKSKKKILSVKLAASKMMISSYERTLNKFRSHLYHNNKEMSMNEEIILKNKLKIIFSSGAQNTKRINYKSITSQTNSVWLNWRLGTLWICCNEKKIESDMIRPQQISTHLKSPVCEV